MSDETQSSPAKRLVEAESELARHEALLTSANENLAEAQKRVQMHQFNRDQSAGELARARAAMFIELNREFGPAEPNQFDDPPIAALSPMPEAGDESRADLDWSESNLNPDNPKAVTLATVSSPLSVGADNSGREYAPAEIPTEPGQNPWQAKGGHPCP